VSTPAAPEAFPRGVDDVADDLTGSPTRQHAAHRTLRDNVRLLSADQAETVLARLREADYPGSDELVQAALDRLEQVGGKRRAKTVRGWWGEAGERAERAAERQRMGTRAEQQTAYRDYVQQLAGQLEDATRGQTVTPRERARQARGQGMPLETILTSNPATMRSRLSEESLRALAELGPPLSFDAWRYANLGARDKRAVASWQARTGSYFSEHG